MQNMPIAEKKLRVTLIKSKFGRVPGHRECVRGLGLHKIRHTVEIQDTRCNRGMINKIAYLLKVEESV